MLLPYNNVQLKKQKLQKAGNLNCFLLKLTIPYSAHTILVCFEFMGGLNTLRNKMNRLKQLLHNSQEVILAYFIVLHKGNSSSRFRRTFITKIFLFWNTSCIYRKPKSPWFPLNLFGSSGRVICSFSFCDWLTDKPLHPSFSPWVFYSIYFI